ncbi:hypothetical protein ACFL5H_03175 [Candidatus Latescibacterota bacterium]
MLAYVKRIYRINKRFGKDISSISRLTNDVKDLLNPIIKVRGSHIHEYRYQSIDLKRLGTIGLLAVHGYPENQQFHINMNIAFQALFSKVQKDLLDYVSDNNKVIENFLDYYFSELKPYVFNENGMPYWGEE